MTDPKSAQPDGPDRKAEAGIEDTQAFQQFVNDGQTEDPATAVGAPFRIITLLIGLAVFAGIVWLLLS